MRTDAWAKNIFLFILKRISDRGELMKVYRRKLVGGNAGFAIFQSFLITHTSKIVEHSSLKKWSVGVFSRLWMLLTQQHHFRCCLCTWNIIFHLTRKYIKVTCRLIPASLKTAAVTLKIFLFIQFYTLPMQDLNN